MTDKEWHELLINKGYKVDFRIDKYGLEIMVRKRKGFDKAHDLVVCSAISNDTLLEKADSVIIDTMIKELMDELDEYYRMYNLYGDVYK